MYKRKTAAFLITLLLTQATFSEISVRVFSREEGVGHNQLSRPRVYIENIGTEPVSNFYCHYYFTAENGKTPVLEDYYTPNSSVSLVGSGNDYIVKYDFNGTTLQPQQIVPNQDGNSIGIRYHDWSPMDKSNDFSCNMSELIILNGNISVFLSDGTQIYGNELPDPQNPPQPPPVSNRLGNFAVYSNEFSDIRDRVEIKGGHVGSAVYAEAGCDAVLSAGIYSGKNIFLRERAVINGDAIASESIHKQNNVVISGTERDHAQIDFPVLETKTVTFGTLDTIAGNGSSFVLTPGDYRDFQAFSNSVITIMPGEYSFRKFLIEPDIQIVLNVSEGETIEFNIGEEIRLADRTVMSFESGTQLPLSFRVYSAQTNQLFIGNDAQIYGFFTAPLAEIHVYSRTNLNGALYGRRVVVEPESEVCKPPVLTGLTHSQIAMAPEFNPLTFSYTAIVPDATATILVIPSVFDSTTVTVNGNPPDTPVNLTSTENAISILLNSPEACGTTEYELNVTKSANYMIYVNADSPCTPGSEDGNSWSTAFKDLQQAIDTALVRGKEIWVAEGEYRPSKLTTESDSGSATFLIKPGIVIKGGFDGTETTDEPSGSAYNTILTGDLAGNDDSLSTWPPSESDSVYLNDNVYHVVTMGGFEGASGIMITGVTIKGGVAKGEGENSVGAGILVRNVSPVLEWCCVTENLADSSGAGVYDNGSIKTIKNCLLKDNVSYRGNGGGLYACGKDSLNIDASVFDGNKVMDTLSVFGGGALFVKERAARLVNCVLTRNSVNGKGGAIINENGTVNITNCTFANNSAVKGIGGIQNRDASTVILNTILWDLNGELADSGFTVTYSCVKDGYAGEGNISENPQFVDIDNPEGDNGMYGDFDDGLLITDGSPCRDAATDVNAPEIDILIKIRPVGVGTDMGAYEYVDMNKCNTLIFGKFRNGVFYEDNDLDRIGRMLHPVEIFQFSRSSYARVMRAYVENNKYTRSKSEIKIYIKPINADNSDAESEIEMRLYKTGEENGLLVFQSLTPDYRGKKIIFTAEHGWHGCNNNWAYILYMSDNPEIHFRVPHSQFR